MLPFLGAIGTVELYSGWLFYQGWLQEVNRDAGDFFVGNWVKTLWVGERFFRPFNIFQPFPFLRNDDYRSLGISRNPKKTSSQKRPPEESSRWTPMTVSEPEKMNSEWDEISPKGNCRIDVKSPQQQESYRPELASEARTSSPRILQRRRTCA